MPDCKDLADALAIRTTHADVRVGGTIEVRPLEHLLQRSTAIVRDHRERRAGFRPALRLRRRIMNACDGLTLLLIHRSGGGVR